ncbi:hypothetical protein F1715_11695, partial [Streptococcus pneumoniae]|uniref:hypothetical protein n=1 Tax=Streptococcus pneumoniae TaxID=1313 RepID=UPI00122ED176
MVETGVDHDRLWGLNTVLSMAFGVRNTRRPLNGVGLKRREALAEVRSLANMVETGVDHDRLWGLNTVLSMAFGVRN